MTDANKPTGPDEKPLVAGSDEIEQLLAQAERLAKELATGTGASSQAGGAGTEGPQGVVADDAVLTATAEVEAKLGEVGTALGPVSDEVGPTEASLQAVSSVDEAPASSEFESGESATVERSELPADAIDSEGVETAATMADEVGGGGEAVSSEVDETPAGTSSEPLKPPRRGLRERAVAVLRFCRTALPSAAKAAPRGFGHLLTILDQPSAGLSPAAKKCIGYAAIATLLVGIASLFLPPLFNRNPYTLPKPAEAEAKAEGAAPAEE
jgi:hypothetical protein